MENSECVDNVQIENEASEVSFHFELITENQAALKQQGSIPGA